MPARSSRQQWLLNHQLFYYPFGFEDEEQIVDRPNLLEEALLCDEQGYPYNAWI
jgi:hypothetical protein